MVVLLVRTSVQGVRKTGRLTHVLTPGDHRDEEASRLCTAEPQTTAGRIALIIYTPYDLLIFCIHVSSVHSVK